MDIAEIFDGNQWVKISIEDFARRVKGIPRERYPALRCVACKKSVYDSGLVTPNAGYLPRFSHSAASENREYCPLSTRSQRFNGLTGNEKTASSDIAAYRRNQFIQFENLRKAWIVCRALRGGKGKLEQAPFIHWIKVADSFGIWRYSYLPDWGIPLLLMLMDNHPTPNGKANFFYIIKKDRKRKDTEWQNLAVRLEAHWLSNGSRIIPNEKKKCSFLLEIPFTENIVNDIISKEDIAWYDKDKLKIIHSFSKSDK